MMVMIMMIQMMVLMMDRMVLYDDHHGHDGVEHESGCDDHDDQEGIVSTLPLSLPLSLPPTATQHR